MLYVCTHVKVYVYMYVCITYMGMLNMKIHTLVKCKVHKFISRLSKVPIDHRDTMYITFAFYIQNVIWFKCNLSKS